MTVRSLHLATVSTLFGILILSACSSSRAVVTTGSPRHVPASDNALSAGAGNGRNVMKEVPHSVEAVSDIKEREAKEPLPPRGDVAIPSHRIPLGDNTVAPTPPACSGGK